VGGDETVVRAGKPSANQDRPGDTDLIEALGRGSGRGVLEGAFQLLRILPGVDGPGQLTELARVTGIPRPSVYRLLAQLRAVGAVELRNGRYRLGNAMFDLGRRVEPAAGLRRGAMDVMRVLREQTGATVSLVAPGRESAVVLDVIAGRETLPVDIYAGCAMPAVSTGALVLGSGNAEHRLRPAQRAAIDEEHTIPGLTCYATAIRLQDRTVAALQITSTTSHNAVRLATLAHQAADRIPGRVRAGS
jgi:DNA-binding IclR family transcriptional regulator